MSNNRSTSRKTVTIGAPKINMSDTYTGFLEFIFSVVDPLLPASFKESEAYKIKTALFTYASTLKGTLVINAAIAKAFASESFLQSATNISKVVDDTEEGQLKLESSVSELKNVAKIIKEYCIDLEETPDDRVKEKIEKFCLYVSFIRDNFVR